MNELTGFSPDILAAEVTYSRNQLLISARRGQRRTRRVAR
jgi:hypothetical protein